MLLIHIGAVLWLPAQLALAEKPAQPCNVYFGSLSGPFISTKTIQPEMKMGRFTLRSQPGYRDDAIYIGIANNGEIDGTHHYYLSVGGKRFDGKPLFGKPKVGSGNIAANGVLFQIPVPPEVVDGLRRKIETGDFRRGASCLHALCRLLESENIFIEGSDRSITSKSISASLVQGKISLNGKPLNPAEMELWETARGEIEHFLRYAPEADSAARAGAAYVIIIYGTLGTAFGSQIWASVQLFLPDKHKPEPLQSPDPAAR